MEIIDKKVAIQKSLAAIGHTNGSAAPEGSSNTLPIAYELFVASELRGAANKRYEIAKQKAAEAGIIDEEKTVEGAEIATWKSKLFDVTMKRSASSQSLDKTMLRNNLLKSGISESKVDQLIAASSKPRKGAVTIGFTLKG